MTFFAYQDSESFYGEPEPAPGEHVQFVPEKLFAHRQRGTEHPLERRLHRDEGLVVHEVATDVLAWPSSLWRVDDLEKPIRLRPGNRWMRCRAFTVVEQAPAWLIAGPHGDAVEWVITQARMLTDAQVDALASLPDEGESSLTRALWAGWTRKHRGSGSPVGCGLTTLNEAVTEAAHQRGPRLFGRDEQDEVEVLSDPAWLRASHAAHAAALGLGAPELLTPQENAVLTRRWITVFGIPDLPER
ncbi:hypothetical protein ACFO3J_23645 [Streptomyces polygonati]|uniref:Uncharacterized protein n=1 Tax=Streptomyces polygonati TaxID=1617087 RepID=A0ABV8HU95_9ACTN